MKQCFIALALTLLSLGNITQAHNIPPELLDYILQNPEASFTELLDQSKDPEYRMILEANAAEVALNLPGKRDVARELLRLPELNVDLVQTYIEADPTLNEVGAEEIYEFLAKVKSLNQNNLTSPEPSFLAFIWLGIIHIIGGLDHVLFVLSLLLLLPKIRDLIALLTAFTIGHSATFLLGGTGLLSLSAQIVEPIIALSISAVAGLALRKSIGENFESKSILAIILLFGLFHGLGFAGVFSDYTPSSDQLLMGILGFNIGVEFGQILIVVLAWPILSRIYKTKYATDLKNAMALGFVIIGLFWFIERLV